MKVLIADDHAIVREGVKQIIRTLPEINLIDEAWEGYQTLEMIKDNGYDLVILDISMPGLSGMDILQNIKTRQLKTNVLILSFYPQEHYAIRAFKLGASGYLSKNTAFEELTLAIRKIASGGKYITSSIAEKLLMQGLDKLSQMPHETLSEREFQVMLMLARGRTVKEIAADTFISDKTVSTYRARIMEKMGLKKNADLTFYAIKNNLI
jgi:two-component system, NarL family, invasion response regulator UvrY